MAAFTLPSPQVMAILVTGASRGIGKAVAKSLASKGYNLVLAARNESALQEVCNGLDHTQGQEHHIAPFDLMDVKAFKPSVPITGLVHSAGIAPAQLLLRTSAHDMERCLHLNTVAPILLTKQLMKQMLRTGGSFVYLSSILAQRGWPGMSMYSASKAAIEAFSRSMAREMGPKGFNFNCVAPALVDTDMGRASDVEALTKGCITQEMLDVQQVADAVLFALENKAINGQVLNIDNGFLA